MKIIYIPLDERPCNYSYPLRAVRTVENITVISPPESILGYKKTAADTQKLWDFIEYEIEDGDLLILSTEMLMYGGLLPSRLHVLSQTAQGEFSRRLVSLKRDHPNIHIYLSNMIMRTPQYNSSDEEPDYYQKYGRDIFLYGTYLDKEQQQILTEQESNKFEILKRRLPISDLEDFTNRRTYNTNLTLQILDLVKNNTIEFMVIPQDDSHEFGFTAIDQRIIYSKIINDRLSEKVLVYPGADEVGYELLARAVNFIKDYQPKIFVTYSSVNGGVIIPNYEDREIGESLKSHVMVCNGYLTSNLAEADFVIAYNTPGKKMIESSMQFSHRNLSYDRNRNIVYFSREIKKMLSEGIKVSICDAAFSNGGDVHLLELLAHEGNYLENLLSYRAWNTNANSLGSVLAESVFGLYNREAERMENLLTSIYDDIFYQAIIRAQISQSVLEEDGLTYFDLKNKQNNIISLTKSQIIECSERYLGNNFVNMRRYFFNIAFPWNRMFEIECMLHKEKVDKHV